jgi:hypothetical protein
LEEDANTIRNNVFAGILVEGGQSTIGAAAERSAGSNRIVSNQGWGVLVRPVTGTVDDAKALPSLDWRFTPLYWNQILSSP